jgi:hypothetical protein
VTLTFDPKINRVLPIPEGNHVAMFGKDPIYRTKVIVRKPVWTPAARRPSPAARHTQSHNTAPSQDGRKKNSNPSFMSKKIIDLYNVEYFCTKEGN